MTICTACSREFTSVSSFDLHLGPIVDGPKQPPCPDPTTKGLEPKSDGRWGAVGSFDWKQHTEGVTTPTYVVAGPRPCGTCGKQMVKSKSGRGRFPKNCQPCGGTGLLTGN